MNKFFLILLLLAVVRADDNFRKLDNKAFKEGEKLTFNVNYGFVTAGIATMEIDGYKKNFCAQCLPCFIPGKYSSQALTGSLK